MADIQTRIDFYHLQKWPLEKALPQLLLKVLGAGKRAVVRACSVERVEALNTGLWLGDSHAWLPHGSARDGFAADQPVWLTAEEENPNEADILVLTDGADSSALGDFERCLDLFDGNDDHAVQTARERWKTRKVSGFELHYWQQTDRGGWEEKTAG